jgi:hypothetical protein
VIGFVSFHRGNAMMRSKSRPAKVKPKSASKPKSKKDDAEKKLPYTIRIELSQGGKVLHEEARSLPATLGKQIVPLVKEETLDRISVIALLRHLLEKDQTGTLAIAPNGNIIAQYGKGKKKKFLVVYAGNNPQRGTFTLFTTSPLCSRLDFGTAEQQAHIVQSAEASLE